ncbi:MAG: hypothetical protein JO013_01150 [Alphaproteobacteria bacterium]|nr:hypothetical protein [Alphaproteobacteria bacterium]
MFMDRIQAEAVVVAPPRKPAALKLVVGLLFVVAASAAMLPWTAVLLVWTLAAALTRAGAAVRDILLHAGEEIVGR